MFMGWVSFYNYFSGDPFASFVETMVVCPQPVPTSDGSCPTGSFYHLGACEPVDNDHHDWSLSQRCSDKALVLETTSQTNGLNAALGSILAMGSVFVGGAIMDHFGRKSILIGALFVNVIVKGLLSWSCFLEWSGFLTILMVQNVLMVMSLSPMYPAMNAMVADLTQGDEGARGIGFAALEVVNHTMDVLAFLCGYPVLAMHLGDYTLFWSSLAAAGVVALVFFSFVLKETRTLKPSPEKSVESHRQEAEGTACRLEASDASGKGCRSVVASCFGGFICVFSDPFARQFFLVWSIANVAVNSTWGLAQMHAQSRLGLSQEVASLARALWHVSLTIGSFVSAALIRRFGAKATLIGGCLVLAVCWAVTGAESALPISAAAAFWVFGVGVGGIAFGMMTPSCQVLVSGRFDESVQGKVFSCQMIVGTLIGVPLGLLWPYYFFDAKATGLRSGLMWFVSAAVLVVCALWMALLPAEGLPQKDAVNSDLEGSPVEDNASSSEDNADISISAALECDSESSSGNAAMEYASEENEENCLSPTPTRA